MILLSYKWSQSDQNNLRGFLRMNINDVISFNLICIQTVHSESGLSGHLLSTSQGGLQERTTTTESNYRALLD